MLQIQNIEKYYGSKNNVTQALDRVSFDVEAGEFLAIMGASGSGKTTLLNCISTIDTISAGKILLDGVNIADLIEEELAKFRRAPVIRDPITPGTFQASSTKVSSSRPVTS